MFLQNKKVAIIGGGPGGLTLARLLQLKGIDAKVYERDLNKNTRVQGSPLDLHNESGLAALRKANLLDEFKNNFLVGANRMKIMNEKAEIFFSDHEIKAKENFDHAHFRPEIDRGVLRTILLESLQSETIAWNSHFISLEKQNKGLMLHFKNVDSVYADVVIAADGANSKARSYVTNIKAFYSGITGIEGTICEAEKSAPNISSMLQGGKITAFGNSKGLFIGQKGNNEIGFYASFKTPENWIASSSLDFSNKKQMLNWFKKEFAEWSNTWHELFETAVTPFIPRPIYCMPLDQTWEAQSNITLLGDAAHVMPPFAGEGVNMAMLDALELSECLTNNQYNNLKDAISAYESAMRKRASTSAAESLENGEKMHSANALQTMLKFFSNPNFVH